MVMQNAQMPPQQYQQQQLNIENNINISYFSQLEPIDKLLYMQGFHIKQKINYIEALTGCVQQNHYEIFESDKFGNQISNLPFMKVEESSSCFQRLCVPNKCRGFQLHFYFLVENQQGTGQWIQQMSIKTKKKCSCTILCCNRPLLEVYKIQENGYEKKIGEVKNPYTCCDLLVESQETIDNKNQKSYTLHADCCQLGIWCLFPCKPCSEIDFKLKNKENQMVKPLKKVYNSLWRSCLGADNFIGVFPEDSNKEQRMLIIAQTLMIDYMYFNVKQQKSLKKKIKKQRKQVSELARLI